LVYPEGMTQSILLAGMLLLWGFSIHALVIYLFIEMRAMKKSTHQITYVDPLAQNFTSLTDEEKENLTKDTFGAIV